MHVVIWRTVQRYVNKVKRGKSSLNYLIFPKEGKKIVRNKRKTKKKLKLVKIFSYGIIILNNVRKMQIRLNISVKNKYYQTGYKKEVKEKSRSVMT